MAKVNLESIEGYSEMSAEDKIKALESYEFELPAPKDETEEVKRLKAALSKANSESAEWKKALREKQTEAERAEADRKERDAKVEEELKSLRRDKTVSGYTAQYLSLGYSKELALKAAEAMADGDAATSLACQQEFLETKTKELEAAALNKQPKLSSGAPPTAKDADKDAINKERAWFGLPPIK